MLIRIRRISIILLFSFMLIGFTAILNSLHSYAVVYQEIVSEMTFGKSMVNYNDSVSVVVKTSYSGTLQSNATLYLEGYNGSTYTQIQVSLKEQSTGVYTGTARPTIGHVGYEFTPSWLEVYDTAGTEYWDYTIKDHCPDAKFKVFKNWEEELTEKVTVPVGGRTDPVDLKFTATGSYDFSHPIAIVNIDDNSIADAYEGGFGFGPEYNFLSFVIQGVSPGTTIITITDYESKYIIKVYEVTVTTPETISQTICVGDTVSVPVEYNSNGLKFSFNPSAAYENGDVSIDYSYAPYNSQVMDINSNYRRYNRGTFSVKVNSIGSYYLNLYDKDMNKIKSVELTVRDHQYNSGTVIQKKTCSQYEIIEYTCVNCGKKEQITGNEYAEHQWNSYYTIDQNASCTTEGSQSKHCSVCGAIDESTVAVIPATGHTSSDSVKDNEVAATCTEDGSYDEVVYCSICNDEISRETKTVPATGHKWNTEYTVDKEPTCTQEGGKSIHCSVCDATKDQEAIPATGHTFGEWIEITPSTCEDSGLRQHTCEICGVTEAENLDPKGHEWEDDYTVDVEATCTTDGSKSYHCKNCEAVKDSTVIPATGHSYGDWETTKEATCTEAGSKEKICLKCGDKISEEIPTLGHAWNSEPTVDKAATCTETGVKSIHCARCDEKAEAISIPAKGHAWNEQTLSTGRVTTAPTKSKEGVATYTCSACKKSITKAIPKLTAKEAEIYASVDSAAATTKKAKQAYQQMDSWSESKMMSLDKLAAKAVLESKEAEKKVTELVRNASKNGKSKEYQLYAQSKLNEAKDAKANALLIDSFVKVSIADNEVTGKVQDLVSEANAMSGEQAIIAAEKAKKASKNANSKIKEAKDISQEALDAIKAAGYTANSDEYGWAKDNINTAVQIKLLNEKMYAKAEDVITKAKKANTSPSTPSVAPSAPAIAAPAEIQDLPAVKITKPKAAKKKITVKWKKVSKKNLKKIDGIQIQVATDPGFANIVKTASAGKKKTSKKIGGLQPKTKYYVRIRAYAAGNHVSGWKSKSVKVK